MEQERVDNLLISGVMADNPVIIQKALDSGASPNAVEEAIYRIKYQIKLGKEPCGSFLNLLRYHPRVHLLDKSNRPKWAMRREEPMPHAHYANHPRYYQRRYYDYTRLVVMEDHHKALMEQFKAGMEKFSEAKKFMILCLHSPNMDWDNVDRYIFEKPTWYDVRRFSKEFAHDDHLYWKVTYFFDQKEFMKHAENSINYNRIDLFKGCDCFIYLRYGS